MFHSNRGSLWFSALWKWRNLRTSWRWLQLHLPRRMDRLNLWKRWDSYKRNLKVSYALITSILLFFFALEIDHCLSYPCKNNGTCHSQVVNYTCECQVGFKGENCKGWSLKMSYAAPLVDVIYVSFDTDSPVNFPVCPSKYPPYFLLESVGNHLKMFFFLMLRMSVRVVSAKRLSEEISKPVCIRKNWCCAFFLT